MNPAGIDRDAIVRRFEAWLDQALAREEVPAGIDAELLAALETPGDPETSRQTDLYSMWAAVTALTQEVKLQGRSFKQLSEVLSPFAALGPEIQRDAATRAWAEVLDDLLDLRDRLARSLESAQQCADRAPAHKRWSRLFPGYRSGRQAREAALALEKGYRLTLERLDEILSRLHVSEIPCLGRPFDARLMRVLDTEETGSVPEGTVLEVYRAGYEWNGAVHRVAQVKVARREGIENHE